MGKSGNPAKRAEQDTPRSFAPTPVDQDGVEDFDAFWTTRVRKAPRVKIMGQVVQLPPSLPLRFEMEARRLAESESLDDVKALLSIIFPGDAMDMWTQAGMDLEQFKVLLAWAPRRIAGNPVTLEEVAEALAKAEAPDPT